MQDLEHVRLTAPDRLRLAEDGHRHIDLQTLAEADLVKVDVKQRIAARGQLHLLDQDLVGPSAFHDQVDQLCLSGPRIHPLELVRVQLVAGGRGAAAIDDGRQAALVPEPARSLADDLSLGGVQLHMGMLFRSCVPKSAARRGVSVKRNEGASFGARSNDSNLP
jgi:hypothetical protein